MRSIVPKTIAFFGLSLGMGCATMRVNVDYDPQAAFAGITTYEWLDSTEISDQLTNLSPFLERRLRRAVDRSLTGEGLVLQEQGDADILVTAFVVVPDGEEMRRCPDRLSCATPYTVLEFGFAYPYAYGYRYPWYRYRFPYRRSPWGYAYSYRIGFGYTWIPVFDRPNGRLPGTVVVDIYNTKRELIWRGAAEGALINMGNAGMTQEYLDEVVSSILERFPPR